jgi:hypothetical protein
MTLGAKAFPLWTLAVAVCAAEPSSAQATVVWGRVLTDSAQSPIPDATVSLGGDSLRVFTDSLGHYRFQAVAPGRYHVQIRRLGFAPLSTALIVHAGDSLNADFRLVAVHQELPPVNVTGTLTAAKLLAFEERRRFGIGRFMTEDDVVKARGTRLSDKVSTLPGLLVQYVRGSNEVRIASTRGAAGFRIGPCRATVMLDGVVVPEFSINWIQPAEVSAIEWYAGPASIPAQFNYTRNECALLMIWTK